MISKPRWTQHFYSTLNSHENKLWIFRCLKRGYLMCYIHTYGLCVEYHMNEMCFQWSNVRSCVRVFCDHADEFSVFSTSRLPVWWKRAGGRGSEGCAGLLWQVPAVWMHGKSCQHTHTHTHLKINTSSHNYSKISCAKRHHNNSSNQALHL